MRRLAFWLALGFYLAPIGLLGEEEHPPEPIGTSIRQESNITVFEAIVPGSLVDWAQIPASGPPYSLALLIELEDEARQVMVWSVDEEGELTELGPRLPDDVEVVMAIRHQSEARSQVLVAAGGVVRGLSAGEWVEVFTSSYDVFPVRDTRGGKPAAESSLVLRSVGELRSLRPDPPTGRFQTVWRFDLPLSVDREWGGLRLNTPPVASQVGTNGEQRHLIIGPDLHGKRRIRSLLLGTVGPEGPTSLETWNMLPTPEEIAESWYVEYNGEPGLIVTTTLAEKHGVFEKKKLRLFTLAADRTRAGSGPLLEVMTKSRNWYASCAGVADVNGDGLDDLVSAQPKGLGAGSLWVEAHIAKTGGGFVTKPRGSEIEVDEGELCTLATDIDGDGRVELVVREGDELLAFPLITSAASKVVVNDSPRWRVKFHDLDGRPRPVQMFGPGTFQMLVTGQTKGKRQAVRLVDFR